MEITKIEVNEAGDYKLLKDGKVIKCKGVVQIHKKDDDLSGVLNPNIIKAMKNCITEVYVAPVETVETLITEKVNELRADRDNFISFNGTEINVSDIKNFTPLLLLDDSKINERLPIETDEGLIIDSIAMLKGICELYVDHLIGYTKKIVDTKKAKTKEEVEAV